MSDSFPSVGVGPYEFDPIGTFMGLDILHYVPIFHPRPCHHEFVVTFCSSQQWHHIWVVESFPPDSRPTDSLRGLVPADQYRSSIDVGRTFATGLKSRGFGWVTLTAMWRP